MNTGLVFLPRNFGQIYEFGSNFLVISRLYFGHFHHCKLILGLVDFLVILIELANLFLVIPPKTKDQWPKNAPKKKKTPRIKKYRKSIEPERQSKIRTKEKKCEWKQDGYRKCMK